MKEELSILLQAEYPLIYLVTHEEDRAEQQIAAIAQRENPNRQVFIWSVVYGFTEYGQTRTKANASTISPEAALQWMVNRKEPGIFVFKDLHPFITPNSPSVVRWLREAIALFRTEKKSMVLMSPIQQVPVEIEKDVVSLDFDLPNMAELDQVLNRQLLKSGGLGNLSEAGREKLLKAALGLTRDEAEKVYRKTYVTRGRLTEDDVDVVLSEKRWLVKRNGVLDFVETDETIEGVGGLGELKSWLNQRSNAFTERAREYGLPQPKGMLILGVPGCGKSLIAKTTSRLWGLPLLRLDMGRVYDGSTVGKSEANLRNALKTAESVSPAILFIDEMDKAFGGAGSSDSDGGTSSRIFGSFLTWMQEKTSPVFVMATANRVERLPSEFLRKGRFDEIFFVDLPTPEERSDIFRIHLQKRKRDIQRFDLEQLAKVSEGFSGAEIEQALIAAMYDAFAQDREFTQLDIIAATRATLPLSKTMSEQVTALRDWARQRARPAATSIAEYQRLEF